MGSVDDHPPATVGVVQGYLADLGRGDFAAASARFSDDLVYVAPGRNQFAGVTRGAGAAGKWFAGMARLSNGSYGITETVDWLASDTRALLIAREHATVHGRDHDWTRAVLFWVDEDTISRVQLFEDDQSSYDTWLDPTSELGDEPQPVTDQPSGGDQPEMSGDLDDPRVRAVVSCQRQVAAGDLENARAIFWPDVTYVVPGRSQMSGHYEGADQVMGYFGNLFALTEGAYSISAMHWLTSPDRVGLVTRNHATRQGRSLAWDELIVFTFVDGRKKATAHFSGDQVIVSQAELVSGSAAGAARISRARRSWPP